MQIFPSTTERTFPEQHMHADFLVAGGGLAGLCAAVAAAREGLNVILVQDRPVLGGNASSEVRLWANGATSHMGNNNRWSREGGIMGEILEENLYRNREGNPVMFDLVLLDIARSEPGLTLLLNTVVYDITRAGNQITQVKGFNAINETFYTLSADRFCDATGDGVLGHLAGAEYRTGAENSDEHEEKMAPGDSFGHKLGHSIYFYTKKTNGSVKFVPPTFALKDITTIPRFRRLTSSLNGCDLWWLEWGGRLDTIHDSEEIKWELWKIVWGVWDYIKNSGEFPDAQNMTIEWVGNIPGKRESRRFMGDYMLVQRDIIEQRDHYDAVGYGGWSIDLHPADGVYSTHDGCRQFHSKGTYTIPYRSLYSHSLDNLFLAGRIISASHVAFGSARVMCTCGLLGEIVGRAAALCQRLNLTTRQLAEPDRIVELQQNLQSQGCFIPRQAITNPAKGATVEASSCYVMQTLAASEKWGSLSERMALLLPLKAGERLPAFSLTLRASAPQTMRVSLCSSVKAGNFTPDLSLGETTVSVEQMSDYTIEIPYVSDSDRYLFIILEANNDIELALSDTSLPGIMMVFNSLNARVAKNPRQIVDADYGVEEFDFWLPRRRPYQIMPAIHFMHPLRCFDEQYLLNGKLRPEQHTNAWIPAEDDSEPVVRWSWPAPQQIDGLTLIFDNDFDNAMETVQMGHSMAITPHCITHFRLWGDDTLLTEISDNRHSVFTYRPEAPIKISQLRLEILDTAGGLPAVYSLNLA